MRSLIYSIVAIAIFVAYGPAARAQVWVDASQLEGRVPDWVDAKYYKPAPTEPALRRIWVEPVYRSVTQRIWHDAAYQTVHERVWVESHYETRPVTTYDPCGCAITHYETVCVPGHFVTVERQVCVPGHWETVQVRELVTPGHWEMAVNELPVR
jgi:hypothetical protein